MEVVLVLHVLLLEPLELVMEPMAEVVVVLQLLVLELSM